MDRILVKYKHGKSINQSSVSIDNIQKSLRAYETIQKVTIVRHVADYVS